MFIERWDRPETLFFLDPPYFGTEHYYGSGLFSPDQHAAMAEALSRLKGRFILTLNDLPETRAIYRAFDIEAVQLTYSTGQHNATAAREIIISGGKGQK